MSFRSNADSPAIAAFTDAVARAAHDVLGARDLAYAYSRLTDEARARLLDVIVADLDRVRVPAAPVLAALLLEEPSALLRTRIVDAIVTTSPNTAARGVRAWNVRADASVWAFPLVGPFVEVFALIDDPGAFRATREPMLHDDALSSLLARHGGSPPVALSEDARAASAADWSERMWRRRDSFSDSTRDAVGRWVERYAAGGATLGA